jgi:uncharacterized membrane protein YdcZ (DUF606 family)
MSGVAGAYFKVLTDTMIITLICSFWTGSYYLLFICCLLKKKVLFSEVKLAKSSTKLKAKNWAYFIEKPLLSFAFVCFFNYFNNLDFD